MSADYNALVSQLHGSILGFEGLGTECAARFPEQAGTNAKAYQAWRERHRSFIDEMGTRFDEVLHEAAKGDERVKAAALAMIDRRTKETLRQQIASGEFDCGRYATLLMDPAMSDPANIFRTQVESIRAAKPAFR